MNGKVARALRHLKAGREHLNAQDVAILSRRLAKQSSLMDMQPKPIRHRKRKVSGVHGQQSYRLDRSAPLIVISPLRFIKTRLEHTTIGNKTGGLANCLRDANQLPKHMLDTIALRS
jgi:hypothetical protein